MEVILLLKAVAIYISQTMKFLLLLAEHAFGPLRSVLCQISRVSAEGNPASPVVGCQQVQLHQRYKLFKKHLSRSDHDDPVAHIIVGIDDPPSFIRHMGQAIGHVNLRGFRG